MRTIVGGILRPENPRATAFSGGGSLLIRTDTRGPAAEPMPADHPILSCPAGGPHSTRRGPDAGGVELLSEGAVDNVIALLEGRPRNVVTGG